MNQQAESTITIIPHMETLKDGKVSVTINFKYQIFSAEQQNGMTPSYIPAFNLFFYFKDDSDKAVISDAATQGFMQSWIEDEGFFSFLRHLKTLGYEPNNGVLDWNKIKKRQINKEIEFKPVRKKTLPDLFEGAKISEMNRNFELAY